MMDGYEYDSLEGPYRGADVATRRWRKMQSKTAIPNSNLNHTGGSSPPHVVKFSVARWSRPIHTEEHVGMYGLHSY